MQSSFFDALDALARSAPIRIDRAKGSAHPRFPDVTYPLDYGFLEGTTTVDGEGVDVFVGNNAGAGVTAAALTVDAGKRDVEVKVLMDCTPGEIDEVFAFLSGTLLLGTTIIHR
ncbi:inorganic pyrophosphatase [Rhodococcus sp. NPDC060090]|uniref:inorganic pyrophosphatase n=1 Tax=Rhodococcus sp. NPDC060090 TaxID=3347056 RepID=UPI0036464A94